MFEQLYHSNINANSHQNLDQVGPNQSKPEEYNFFKNQSAIKSSIQNYDSK